MIKELFQKLVDTETSESRAKTELNEAKSRLMLASGEVKLAWDAIADYMSETGEYEILIEGKLSDFKICRTPISKSIDVLDIDSVPEEFIRIKKEPDKIAIKAAFKDADMLPNWLTYVQGGGNLTWKTQKKKA